MFKWIIFKIVKYIQDFKFNYFKIIQSHILIIYFRINFIKLEQLNVHYEDCSYYWD